MVRKGTAALKAKKTLRVSKTAAFFIFFWVSVSICLAVMGKWGISSGQTHFTATKREAQDTFNELKKLRDDLRKQVSRTPVTEPANTLRPMPEPIPARDSQENHAELTSSQAQEKSAPRDSTSTAEGSCGPETDKTPVQPAPAPPSPTADSRSVDLDSLWEQVNRLKNAGNWNEAIQTAEEALNYSPASTRFRKALGICLADSREFSRALRELEEVVHDREGDAEVYHVLGHVYYNLGSFRKAYDSFEEAVRMEPDNPRHYICGAKFIEEAAKRDVYFQQYRPVAQSWSQRAAELQRQQG